MAEALVLGIDIGGTKTAAGCVSSSGGVVDYAVAATPARSGSEAILDAAADLAAQVAAGRACDAVGVAAPGVINRTAGSVVSATGLLTDWAGARVRDGISARLRLPAVIDNDVTAAAFGEARVGACRGVSSLLFVALGTGIGGGLVLDGTPWHGAFGIAGHLGHLAVPEAEGRRCSCGREGHLEALVSGSALLRDALADGIEVGGARELAALAESGHGGACRLLARAGRVLGRTLGGLVNTLDVQAIVIGGGMAAAGPALWKPLEAGLRGEVLPPAKPALTRSALGDRAGVIGAACLAFEAVAPRSGGSR